MSTNLLEPDLHEPFHTWKANPSPENADVLLGKINPIINESLRSYGSGSADSPTMRSKAKLFALNSLSNYDPSKAKIRTYLLSQLQSLRRQAAKEDQIIHVPEQAMLDLKNLRNAELELEDQLGRGPSEAEIRDFTGLSKKRISKIKSIKPSYSEGSQTREVDDGLMNMSGPIESSPSTTLQKSWQEFVYHDLDPIDQVIMEHSLGLYNKPVLSNKEIARKLNLSPGAITQRKTRIQTKLDYVNTIGLF